MIYYWVDLTNQIPISCTTTCQASSKTSKCCSEACGRHGTPHAAAASGAGLAILLGQRMRGSRSLPALVQAAWRRADLDVPKRRAWTRRVRVATLLPEVSVGYDRRRDRGWDHHLQLDAPDAEVGFTALHLCCEFNLLELGAALLAAGASTSSASFDLPMFDGSTLPGGRTPLHVAAMQGNSEMVRLLLNVQRSDAQVGAK